MTRNEIVVGLDDSPSGKAALRWAADQAIHREAALRAIHVLDWPYGADDTTFDAPPRHANLTFDEAQANYLACITRVFDDISPRPDWRIEFAKGKPGQVLVRESRDAQLLVVGTREHVGLGRLLTGSTSHYCLSHASCPVVSVPALTDVALEDQEAIVSGPGVNKIVVGLDLSPSSRTALRWAAEQARATGLGLLAVHAGDASSAFIIALRIRAAPLPMDVSAMNSSYREAIAAIFDSIQPEPGWRLRFYAGEAGPVLVAESVGAAMLVVGTKEHVGIGRLTSGSVSHYCLGHAQAPVVTVPTVRGQSADPDHDHASADRPAAD